MPRLFGCKYNAEVSYIGCTQKSSRDYFPDNLFLWWSTHDPAQALEQDKMKPCIALFPLWKITIYSGFFDSLTGLQIHKKAVFPFSPKFHFSKSNGWKALPKTGNLIIVYWSGHLCIGSSSTYHLEHISNNSFPSCV